MHSCAIGTSSNFVISFTFRTTMESFEGLSVSVKIAGFINMAMKKEISWATLSIIVQDLTSTHEQAQNVVRILLQVIQFKFQNNDIETKLSPNVPNKEIEVDQNVHEDEEVEVIEIVEQDHANKRDNSKIDLLKYNDM